MGVYQVMEAGQHEMRREYEILTARAKIGDVLVQVRLNTSQTVGTNVRVSVPSIRGHSQRLGTYVEKDLRSQTFRERCKIVVL